MKKRKTGTIMLLLVLGLCAFMVVIVQRFIHDAELIHRVLPELRNISYILMRYLNENGCLPADETQLIAHGHIRKIHQGDDENLWEFSGGYSRWEPSWYKLHFFEDFSISYGLTTTDMELSGDVVVDKVKKVPLLIINGPGSDKYLDFYQVETFDLYNCMCRNYNSTYQLLYPNLEWTRLHQAVKNNNVEEVELLLKEDVDVNAKATGLFTPLHVAATYGFVDIAKRLLNNDANVNTKDTGGFSALHIAAINGNFDVVKLLMENGADIHLKTNAGRTALDEAASHSHKDIYDFLSGKKK